MATKLAENLAKFLTGFGWTEKLVYYRIEPESGTGTSLEGIDLAESIDKFLAGRTIKPSEIAELKKLAEYSKFYLSAWSAAEDENDKLQQELANLKDCKDAPIEGLLEDLKSWRKDYFDSENKRAILFFEKEAEKQHNKNLLALNSDYLKIIAEQRTKIQALELSVAVRDLFLTLVGEEEKEEIEVPPCINKSKDVLNYHASKL